MTTIEERYPEHMKLKKIAEKSQAIGEFLDNSKYVLAEYRKFEDREEEMLVPAGKPIVEILAEWFDIDMNLIEKEKREMLEWMMAGNS